MEKIDNIIQSIVNVEKISDDDMFSYVKTLSFLYRENEALGRRLLINLLNNKNKISSSSNDLLADIIELYGFYPYLQKEGLELNNIGGYFRYQSHFSSNLGNKYFHEEQKKIKDLIFQGENLIISAPTSFGKSLLIEEIVSSNKFSNIIIIQPTLALLEETRKKLKRYDKYKLIFTTEQTYQEEGNNLFLLTAERFMEYEDLPKIDFFVIDEFYKLSTVRDDERSDVLNNSFYKLLHLGTETPQFCLLGPNIDKISEGFEESYNCKFIKTDYSLIETHTYNITSGKTETERQLDLFKWLSDKKDEQSLIYCSSPAKAMEMALKFCEYLEGHGTKGNIDLPLIEWINKEIDSKRFLGKILSFGIGVNNGAIPKHINSSIIDYFNAGDINYIFCTSTIIEGVNTSAKNIFYYSCTKGNKKQIDYFDYSNIKGRAGRMMIHYIGNVYNFQTPPEKNEDTIVDIPFFQQNPIRNEVLNYIDDKDIKEDVKGTEQYKSLVQIPEEERALFRKNGVLIEGQKLILDKIKNLDEIIELKIGNNIIYSNVYELLNWKSIPRYEQLFYLINLCWYNLFKPGESKNYLSYKRLTKLTWDYYIGKNLSKLVENTYKYKLKNSKDNETQDEIYNKALIEILNINRHRFEYKLPKRLNVVNELQKYVCEKQGKEPGNYSYFAKMLERGFVKEGLGILMEFGIPLSTIRKIEKHIIKVPEDENELKNMIKSDVGNFGLLKYEEHLILKNL